MFRLHPDFERTSYLVEELSLSELRLHNCASNPWLILIPQVDAEITEIHQLDAEQQLQLLEEINLVSSAITKLAQPDLLNIGKLGNVTPQLHIHVIARFKNDPFFPNPIWGNQLEAYDPLDRESTIQELQHLLMGYKY